MDYTVDDLRRELGNLYIECRVRAQREIALVERIKELEAEILASLKPVEKTGGE